MKFSTSQPKEEKMPMDALLFIGLLKDKNIFVKNKNSKMEKELKFKVGQILEFDIYGDKVKGKFIKFNLTNDIIYVEIIEDSYFEVGSEQLIYKHHLLDNHEKN